MLSYFQKNFQTTNLSQNDLISYIVHVTPYIILLSDQEQIAIWQCIGSRIDEQQQHSITDCVYNMFNHDDQQKNYAQGIALSCIDTADMKKSIDMLKKIEQPDYLISSALSSMETIHTSLLNHTHLKMKKM